MENTPGLHASIDTFMNRIYKEVTEWNKKHSRAILGSITYTNLFNERHDIGINNPLLIFYKALIPQKRNHRWEHQNRNQ